VIGGTVVNIAVAMGLGASISGWEIDRSLVQFDIPYLLFSAVVLILFIATRSKLDRKESALIFALYAVYIALKLFGF
jgi:Ca2+/Na+ antiporter